MISIVNVLLILDIFLFAVQIVLFVRFRKASDKFFYCLAHIDGLHVSSDLSNKFCKIVSNTPSARVKHIIKAINADLLEYKRNPLGTIDYVWTNTEKTVAAGEKREMTRALTPVFVGMLSVVLFFFNTTSTPLMIASLLILLSGAVLSAINVRQLENHKEFSSNAIFSLLEWGRKNAVKYLPDEKAEALARSDMSMGFFAEISANRQILAKLSSVEASMNSMAHAFDAAGVMETVKGMQQSLASLKSQLDSVSASCRFVNEADEYARRVAELNKALTGSTEALQVMSEIRDYLRADSENLKARRLKIAENSVQVDEALAKALSQLDESVVKSVNGISMKISAADAAMEKLMDSMRARTDVLAGSEQDDMKELLEESLNRQREIADLTKRLVGIMSVVKAVATNPTSGNENKPAHEGRSAGTMTYRAVVIVLLILIAISRFWVA